MPHKSNDLIVKGCFNSSYESRSNKLDKRMIERTLRKSKKLSGSDIEFDKL